MPLHGYIDVAVLPRVVRDLWSARATGILQISNGPTAKQIIFKKGEIVFAATNVEQERLGERLVRAGKIKRSILDLTFRVMERSHLRFGKTIVEWGWVSPWEMQRRVAEQIKDIVFSVFTWSSGEYRFEPSEEPVDPDLLMELHTAEVIWEGVRRMSDRDAIRVGVGDPRAVLELAGGKRLGIPIGQKEGFILARVDGRSTISEIVSASRLAEEDALRCIYALLLAGVVERKDSPDTSQDRPEDHDASGSQEETAQSQNVEEDERVFRDGLVARYAAMPFGNLYDRLEVDVRASAEKIREAYQEVMKSIEPEPHYRDRLEDLQPRLEKVKRKVTEAYTVLSDPLRRRAYDMSISGASPDWTLASEDGVSEAEKTLAESPVPGR